MSRHRLDALLSPRSIAFVGASTGPDTPGNDMMRMIRKGGYKGEVFAVNPNSADIDGYPCFPSLAALPSPPDLAVLAVKSERLEETLTQAIEVGARAAVIFASAQLADDTSPNLSQRLAEKARTAEMPICGPNCMGFYNELDNVWICGFPSPRVPRPGSIALIAHSGSVFGALAHNDPRLRFALAVSPGQELTLTVADYISYAVDRPEVKVVGLFIETARDPQGFRAALRKAALRRIPVVALKVGRTEAAAKAALTHTGAIAGSDMAYQALFDHCGVMRVETIDEMAATLMLLSQARLPGKGGLVSIHDSGGERELIIDLAERARVDFAKISDQTRQSIAARLEPGLEPDNPLDAWGTGIDFVPQFAACLEDLMKDDGAAIGLFCADIRDDYYLHKGFADAAMMAARRTEKPIAVVTNYTQVRHDTIASVLSEAGVPVLDGTWNGLIAVRGALAYRNFLEQGEENWPSGPQNLHAVRDRIAGRGTLTELDSLAVLSEWNIPVVDHRAVASRDEALAAARQIGFPVVLKTAAKNIAHKSDVGGVKLNITDEASLKSAYEDFAARLGLNAIIARQLSNGVELSVGMVRDPQFGPVIVIGAGGVLVELLDDRVSVLPPFAPGTALRLLERLKIWRLLNGVRGQPPVDINRLALTLSRFSVMCEALKEVVVEIDVNPLICGADIVAVDALIVT